MMVWIDVAFDWIGGGGHERLMSKNEDTVLYGYLGSYLISCSGAHDDDHTT